MGLDMYLNKHYHRSPPPVGKSKKAINGLRVCEEVCEAIYWRKANAIHGWFVRNVQGGQDDCKEYEVPVEQLKGLLKLVTKALKTKQPGELAPTPGFFFGSTDIDEDYWADLEHTKTELTSVLKLHKEEKGDAFCWFTYRASW